MSIDSNNTMTGLSIGIDRLNATLVNNSSVDHTISVTNSDLNMIAPMPAVITVATADCLFKLSLIILI